MQIEVKMEVDKEPMDLDDSSCVVSAAMELVEAHFFISFHTKSCDFYFYISPTSPPTHLYIVTPNFIPFFHKVIFIYCDLIN